MSISNQIKEFINEIKPDIATTYEEWRRKHLLTEEERILQREHRFEYMPVISIVVPAYKTPHDFLVQMIESVMAQTYSHWELCIADASMDDSICEILEDYKKKDERIKYILLEENLGISDNTNRALEIATGEFVALLDHDDTLEENALFEVVKCINNSHVEVVYTDEDKVSMDLKRYFDPSFKPDFNRELLMSCNYITHFFVVKRSVIDRVGFLDDKYDGSQDYDFILRATSAVEAVGHVDKVLYHWRSHENSTAMNPEAKLYCYEAGEKAVQRALDEEKVPGEAYMRDMWGYYGVKYKLHGNPSVLTFVINGQSYISHYENEEIVYIDDEHTIRVYDRIADIMKGKQSDYVFIVQGNGELAALGMENLLANIIRENVGMVCCKVISSDDKIVEAGRIVSRPEGYQNICEGLDKEDRSYGSRAFLQQEVSAYGFNGIMISYVDCEEYLSRIKDKEDESISAFVGSLNKKIVYLPDTEYIMAEKLKEIRKNYLSLPEKQREDAFYNKTLAKKETPYSFVWDKTMGVQSLIKGYARRLRNKKSVVLLFAALILSMSIGIGMMWPSLQARYLGTRDDDLIDTVYLDSSTVCHDVTIDDEGNLTLDGSDGYFEINNIQHPGKTVALNLKERINQGEVLLRVSVDYGDGKGYGDEEQEIVAATLRGADCMVISIPSDSYTDLKISPNANLSIASVEFHSKNYTVSYQNYPQTKFRIILGIIVGGLLWIVSIFAEAVFKPSEKLYAWVKKL